MRAALKAAELVGMSFQSIRDYAKNYSPRRAAAQGFAASQSALTIVVQLD
jgi:hypothetical protein